MGRQRTEYTKQELREIREQLAQLLMADNWTPPEETEVQKKARIAHLMKHPVEALMYYYPHYFTSPFSAHHKKYIKRLWYTKIGKEVNVCHREWGKTIIKECCYSFRMIRGLSFFYVKLMSTKSVAQLSLGNMEVELRHNPRILHDFGQLVSDNPGKLFEFELKNGAKAMAAGQKSKTRGIRQSQYRVTDLDIDDLDDDELCENEASVQKMRNRLRRQWFSVMSRKAEVRYVNMTGTPIGTTSVLSDIEKHPGFKVFKHPTEDEDGNIVWPERFTAKDLREWEEDLGSNAYAQECLLKPVVEGHMFSRNQIVFAKPGQLRSWEHAEAYIDVSFTKTGDYKAGAIVLFRIGDDNRPRYHVLDLMCRKCDSDGWLDWVFDKFFEYDKRGLRLMFRFDAAVTQDLYHMPLIREYEARLGITLPIVPDKERRTNKLLHIQRLQPDFERGNFTFDHRLEGTHDMNTAIDQMMSVGKGSSAHDDFPDALASAHSFLEPYNTPRQAIYKAEALASYNDLNY